MGRTSPSRAPSGRTPIVARLYPPLAGGRVGARGRVGRSGAALAAVAWPLAFLLATPRVGAEDQEQPPRILVVTPQAEPSPALRYRLLPSAAEMNPGNAAPVYLRLYAETRTEAKEQIGEKATAWLAEPFDEFPAGEARAFVNQWGSRTRQMAFAARRSECDWAYTLPEQREEAYSILLPDVQEVRNMARLLALKARAEIAEGEHDEAIRTIETGLAMARHLAKGPFLINGLVSIAVANQFVDRVEELVGRPDAPNLYWALTALPRPFIDLRDALEIEQMTGEWLVPQIVGLDDLRGAAEWDARLERLHSRLGQLHERYRDDGIFPKAEIPGDVAGFRAAMLPPADAFFAAIDAEAPEGEAERILRFVAENYRRARDQAFKATYLPFAEADAFYRQADPEADADRPLVPVPALIPWPLGEVISAIRSAHLSQARLDRRIAALRVVEAIRLHAAGDGGALPESLDAIMAVPVPADPISGEPFSYHLGGNSALLEAPEVPVSVPPPGVSYRVVARKRPEGP